MRVLVTGINGFVASHLTEFLLENVPDVQIYGTVRRRSYLGNIATIKDKLRLSEFDLCDSHSIDKVIADIKPDKIFHLAAQSFVPTSWKIPVETFNSNINGTLNILEAVRAIKDYDPVIQIAGSSEEYGLVLENELPIKETNPLRPLSPYAVSKVTQDLLGYQYFKSYGMKIVRTRAFNHSGIRRPSDFVDSGFAKQIAMIERGDKNKVLFGNLQAIRDFSDVKDVVRAYWMATEDPRYFGEAVNICSGVGWKIQDMLNVLIENATCEIPIQQDLSKMRPSDVPVLIGDSTFIRECGWRPEIDYRTTLLDMLNFWRKRLDLLDNFENK
jgi:GDP-4-dehydro-6-deoxy-D-mannose reductase